MSLNELVRGLEALGIWLSQNKECDKLSMTLFIDLSILRFLCVHLRIDFISITVVPRDPRHGILGRATNSNYQAFSPPTRVCSFSFSDYKVFTCCSVGWLCSTV